jgi:PAS domain S-box-containing protein
MDVLNTNKKESVLTFVFIIALITLFVLVAISYQKIMTTIESENTMIHSYNVHLSTVRLASNINETELKQRDFIDAQDSTSLSEYNLAVKKLRSSYDDLKAKLKNDSLQQKNLDTLKNYMDQKFELLNPKIDRSGIAVFKNKAEQNKKTFKMLLLHANKMAGIEIFTLYNKEASHLQDRTLPPVYFLCTALFTILVFSISYWKIQSGYSKLKKTNNELTVNKTIYEYSEEIGGLSHFYNDINSDKIVFSENGYKMLGCSFEEFNTLTRFNEFIHPDDRHLASDLREKIISGEDVFFNYFRIIRKDGTIRHLKATGKVISDSFQKKILIGIYADVTDEFKKSKELEEKIFDLEISNKELSAFNYVASHDLQEPLRKVQLFISRIRMTHFDSFPQTLKDSFIRIEVAANRMERLINDLLLFSRSNKLNKDVEKTNLNQILENTLQEFDESLSEKKASISGGILPTIEAIPFQIQQLFNNIISNSLKYAKKNVPLSIAISTKIVSGDDIPRLRNKTLKYYQISFADNGIGFNQEHAESIFTIFSRLHDNSEYSGTGIGLAICKKITDNHKGAIDAEGTPGVGATFNVYFPV